MIVSRKKMRKTKNLRLVTEDISAKVFILPWPIIWRPKMAELRKPEMGPLPNPDSLTMQSIEIGKSRGYFGQMKYQNPTVFNTMVQLGEGRVADGYYLYVDDMNSVRDEFLFLYSRLETTRKITAFCRFASISKYTFRSWGLNLIGSEMMRSTTLIDVRKIIIKIDEFIHEVS